MTTAVIALCDIPEGYRSLPGVGPIDLRRLFNNASPSILLHVNISKNHLNVTGYQVKEDWACFIAIARNCHEQNVEITNSSQGLILQTIKPIKASEELFVWVGPDLLSKLEFPFLHPVNIKGNQNYICHKCGSVFENPNPLKIHLSFLCDTLREFSTSEMQLKNDNVYQLNHLDILKLKKEAKDSPTNGNSLHFQESIPFILPISQNKCFQNANHSKSFYASMNMNSRNNKNRIYSPTKQATLFQPSLPSEVPCNLASSVVTCCRGSQGHACSFCGKIYSRKYGLKIHVRTHTGYKPLKCKYCLRPFSDPSNLNKHVRLHSETDAPYRCLKCGKILVRRRDLERHMKSRHPETPSYQS